MTAANRFLITTETLEHRLTEKSVVLFDVTSGAVPIEGREIAASEAHARQHIPGAVWVDQAKTLSDATAAFGYMAPQPAQLAKAFAALGVTAESTVVLYSAGSYGWATRVWWLLRSIGFEQAYVLDGGLQKWLAEGREVEQGVSTPNASTSVLPVTAREVFVGRERVFAAVQTNNATIVDALSLAQFDGTAPGKHARRGHILHAVNLPASGFIDAATNTFKSPEYAADLIASTGIAGDRPLIAYCGAGVAASIDAFAALRAGLDRVFIYDASLAEWANDASLPMEPGSPS